MTGTKLIALIVADMQHPVTRILKAALIDDELHDAHYTIARLSEVVYHCAPVIEENFLRIGSMEINLGHAHLLRRARSHEISAEAIRPTRTTSSSSGFYSLGFARVDEALSFLSVRHFCDLPAHLNRHQLMTKRQQAMQSLRSVASPIFDLINGN